MDTLITTQDTWALWAVVLATAAVGLWLERTRIGARLSGAVFTLIAACLLSNFGVIPAAAPVYETIWTYLVPLAIPLLLFNPDLRRVLRESAATLVAFSVGAVGTVVGAVAAAYLFSFGENTWRLAAVFSASYISGPMNYAATAQAVGLHSRGLLAGGIAAINLIMAIYLVILFVLPTIWGLRRSYHEAIPDRWGVTAEIVYADSRIGTSIYLPGIASALALSAVICATGYYIETRYGWKGTAILIAAGITMLIAIALPRKMEALKGANEIGMLLMQLLFVTIGAGANITAARQADPDLLAFAGMILAIHFLAVLLGGKLLRLSLPELIIASNVNIGGPATGAAMASARRWYQFVIPAILCGVLGYTIAQYIGITLGGWLR